VANTPRLLFRIRHYKGQRKQGEIETEYYTLVSSLCWLYVNLLGENIIATEGTISVRCY
jgi:hypothetical protein